MRFVNYAMVAAAFGSFDLTAAADADSNCPEQPAGENATACESTLANARAVFRLDPNNALVGMCVTGDCSSNRIDFKVSDVAEVADVDGVETVVKGPFKINAAATVAESGHTGTAVVTAGASEPVPASSFFVGDMISTTTADARVLSATLNFVITIDNLDPIVLDLNASITDANITIGDGETAVEFNPDAVKFDIGFTSFPFESPNSKLRFNVKIIDTLAEEDRVRQAAEGNLPLLPERTSVGGDNQIDYFGWRLIMPRAVVITDNAGTKSASEMPEIMVEPKGSDDTEDTAYTQLTLTMPYFEASVMNKGNFLVNTDPAMADEGAAAGVAPMLVSVFLVVAAIIL